MEDKKELKQWWLSLDGDLDPAEQKRFEQAMEKDAELATTFFEAKTLDNALSKQEAEQPSMRFSKNVFEQLPQLYRKISIEPLFTKKALTIGILSVLSFFVLSVIPAFLLDGNASGNVESNFWETYINQLSNIPNQWLLTIGLVSFCLTTVILLDQFLKKQILKKKQKVAQ
ncbi:MAG: hypothetical protein Sapg2KO_28570 [Saprospiraceae bacterium]